MLRVLYIDVPFEAQSGARRVRSQFLWTTAAGEFDAERLILLPDGFQAPLRPPPPELHPECRVTLLPAITQRLPASLPTYRFQPADLAVFDRLLEHGRYDLVLVRSLGAWRLAMAAQAHPTRPAVVLDIDRLNSRLLELAWKYRPRLSQARLLLDRWLIERQERRIARRPFLFLFNHPGELHYFRSCISMEPQAGRFAHAPNILSAAPVAVPSPEDAILFFGQLDSPANQDATRYLLDVLFPLLEADLHRHAVRIRIAGRNPPKDLSAELGCLATDRLVLVNSVERIEPVIAASRFVFLPLRVAAGTCSRILESAAQRRTVVTSPIGAEGLDLGEDLLVGRTPEAMALAVRQLLDDPPLAAHLGRRLHAHAVTRFSPTVVARGLSRELTDFAADRPARH